MAGNCALDETGLRAQYERYRRAGEGARVLDRTPRRLVVGLDEHLDTTLVDELLAIERECCPFFGLSFEPGAMRLTVSVSRVEHEPALDAISFALDLDRSAGHAAPH
jgi:hypothetical protein